MNPFSQAACMCPWAPSSLRSYRLLHRALPAGETWAWTMQNEIFCRPERAFSCKTASYLRKGKKSRPCTGQATGWSLTYREARSAVGPGAAGCADLPLLGRSRAKAPHLGTGPRPRQGGRKENAALPQSDRPPPPPLRSRAGSARYGLVPGRCRGARRPAQTAIAPRPSVRRRRHPPRTPTHQGGRGGELGASEHLSGRRPGGLDPASLRREGEGECAAGGGGDGRGWREWRGTHRCGAALGPTGGGAGPAVRRRGGAGRRKRRGAAKVTLCRRHWRCWGAWGARRFPAQPQRAPRAGGRFRREMSP